MHGDQRLEGQASASGALAQRAQQREAVAEIHCRPPGAVALRKPGAGEHGVVAADPAAERDLHAQQRQHGPGTAPHTGSQRQRAPPEGLVLQRQHGQQHRLAEQVQRHHQRVELERDRVLAEQALHHHPDQGQRRPPGRKRQALAMAPAEHRHDQDQRTDGHRQVAVDHLDPGLGPADGAAGQCRLRGGDVVARAERADLAVAARPVGATEAGIGESREGTEDDEIEGQEHRQRRQPRQAAARVAAALAQPQPRQGQQRNRRRQQQQAHERGEVDQRCGVHDCAQRPAVSQEAEARSRRSRSRLTREGSASAGMRIIHSPIGSTT